MFTCAWPDDFRSSWLPVRRLLPSAILLTSSGDNNSSLDFCETPPESLVSFLLVLEEALFVFCFLSTFVICDFERYLSCNRCRLLLPEIPVVELSLPVLPRWRLWFELLRDLRGTWGGGEFNSCEMFSTKKKQSYILFSKSIRQYLVTCSLIYAIHLYLSDGSLSNNGKRSIYYNYNYYQVIHLNAHLSFKSKI